MSDIIEKMKKEYRARHERELTPADVEREAMLMPLESRIACLTAMDTPAAMNPREAGDRLALERAFRNTHTKMRTVGR